MESADVELLPIDRRVLLKAAELRAATRLKTPDAIHAATAIVSNCASFLTNDHRIRQIADIPVVHLSDIA